MLQKQKVQTCAVARTSCTARFEKQKRETNERPSVNKQTSSVPRAAKPCPLKLA